MPPASFFNNPLHTGGSHTRCPDLGVAEDDLYLGAQLLRLVKTTWLTSVVGECHIGSPFEGERGPTSLSHVSGRKWSGTITSAQSAPFLPQAFFKTQGLRELGPNLETCPDPLHNSMLVSNNQDCRRCFTVPIFSQAAFLLWLPLLLLLPYLIILVVICVCFFALAAIVAVVITAFLRRFSFHMLYLPWRVLVLPSFVMSCHFFVITVHCFNTCCCKFFSLSSKSLYTGCSCCCCCCCWCHYCDVSSCFTLSPLWFW